MGEKFCKPCGMLQDRCICTKQQAKKNDALDDKLRFDLIPVLPMVEVAKVFTMGAKKYGDRNWERGLQWMRCVGAIMRHLSAWVLGEANDRESGINHLAHVVVNLLFLLEYQQTHPEMDNRPVKQNLNVQQCFEMPKEQNHE
jgi:hypothetical protein